MDDLDELLGRLARAPVPPALASLEDRVLARIAAKPAAQVGIGLSVATVVAALIMGVAAGGAAAPASAVSTLAPLGSHSPLAPSTLLAGTP